MIFQLRDLRELRGEDCFVFLLATVPHCVLAGKFLAAVLSDIQ
jgi:hypothetical protein